MKILWICDFSNSQIREKLHFSDNKIENFVRFLFHIPKLQRSDLAAWITNGIAEFEKEKDVELHIISPQYELKYITEEFELRGIYYHFFKPDDDSLVKRIVKTTLNKTTSEFKRNRRIIKQFINKINPDLIHLFGAENPNYSITALDIDFAKIPFVVTLQTLLSDPEFIYKQRMPLSQYNFRAGLERKILEKANYISSEITKYRQVIWNDINPKAIFTNNTLALAEDIVFLETEKAFDFVYFAVSIEKAADVAIEAFALACKKMPSLTLNIIGGCSTSFKRQIGNRITELGIEKNVTFSGKLSSHEEVLRQIQNSRYALLPLKIDHISGTIREAMFSGIPVLTTRTYGTPSLNENRESVLISDLGDYETMARNMIRLVESPKLAEQLRKNGLTTVNERWNNNKIAANQVKAYRSILAHHHFKKHIPAEIATYNQITDEIR